MNDWDDILERRRRQAARLVAALGGRCTARQLSRRLWRYRNIRTADALLMTMADRGMGRWETVPPGPKGGRPTRVFVLCDAREGRGYQAENRGLSGGGWPTTP